MRHDVAPLSQQLREIPAIQVFEAAPWSDVWDDARMVDVVQYLLGNNSLQLPAEWRRLFPAVL